MWLSERLMETARAGFRAGEPCLSPPRDSQFTPRLLRGIASKLLICRSVASRLASKQEKNMKHLLSSALCLTVLATSAFADTRLAEIRTHAGKLQKGSEQVNLLLKAKQPDAQAVRDGIAAMGGISRTSRGWSSSLLRQIRSSSSEVTRIGTFSSRKSSCWLSFPTIRTS